jgi:ribose transport system substrate-binding protein
MSVLRLRKLVCTVAAVGVVAALLVAVAAGSSSAKSGSKVSGVAASSSGLAAAKAFEAVALNPKVDITKPLGKPLPKHKTIWDVISSLQASINYGNGVTQGGKAAGWNVVTKVTALGPPAVDAVVADALKQRPSAVIFGGIQPTIAQEIALRKAGVALVSVGEVPSKYWNLTLRGPRWQALQGESADSFAVTSSNGKPTTVGMINVPEYASIVEITAGVTKGLHKWCPKCTLKVDNLAATSLGVNSNALITNWLRANPGVDYLFLPVDTVISGLPAALQAAGVKLPKIVSFFGSSISYPYLHSGQEAAVVGTEDYAQGWETIDGLARTFIHESDAVDQNPEGVPPTISVGRHVMSIPLGPVGYKAAFRKLWGLT